MKNINKAALISLFVLVSLPTVTQAGLISWLVGKIEVGSPKFNFEKDEHLTKFAEQLPQVELSNEKLSKEDFFATLIVRKKFKGGEIQSISICATNDPDEKKISYCLEVTVIDDGKQKTYLGPNFFKAFDQSLHPNLYLQPTKVYPTHFDISNYISYQPTVSSPVHYSIPPVLAGLCSAGLTAGALKMGPSIINYFGLAPVAGQIVAKATHMVSPYVCVPTQHVGLGCTVLAGLLGGALMYSGMKTELESKKTVACAAAINDLITTNSQQAIDLKKRVAGFLKSFNGKK